MNAHRPNTNARSLRNNFQIHNVVRVFKHEIPTQIINTPSSYFNSDIEYHITYSLNGAGLFACNRCVFKQNYFAIEKLHQ